MTTNAVSKSWLKSSVVEAMQSCTKESAGLRRTLKSMNLTRWDVKGSALLSEKVGSL